LFELDFRSDNASIYVKSISYQKYLLVDATA